jgi:uncharacterized protein (TIGR02466 family)
MAVNAIDFSDLTKKPKPQGFQTPPPQPQPLQNKQIGLKKSDGTVEPAMGYPVNQIGQGDELLQLFPIPVMICPYPVDYSRELEWIRNCETRKENNGGEIGNKVHYNRQSEDTFVLDKPELANIRAFIEAKIHKFATEIMASTDKLVITQSWLNKNKKGESHHEHVHPNSMISGVWYPQIHEELPPIQFRSKQQRDVTLSSEKFNTFNSATFMLPMKRGELILFPSNLQHSVPVNNREEERISLSFNTWPKGNLGDIKSLTYLPLDRCV